MKLLHISDLHVTYPGESLETIWFGPAAALRQRRLQAGLDQGEFDFVVISGDLSQSASTAEYEALEHFIRNSILPLLKTPDVWRVILVPGNHDVDWRLKFPEWDAWRCNVEDDLLTEEWRHLARAPELSRLRVEIGHGSAKFFDIGVAKAPGVAPYYLDRFRNVQDLFDRLYGEPLPGNKRFNLLTDGDDWSLHTFDDERVAFFGLNSCSRNDKLWAGASFSRAALVQVAQEARGLMERWGADALLVAVWHHGIESEKGRPDRLDLRDIAALHNAGIRVVFHGHVHQDVSRIVRLLDRSMVLVSTGSIGACAEDRPECIRNQFGVVDLNPAYVSVQRYERDPTGIYAATLSELFHLYQSTSTARPQANSLVDRQSRTWNISADGIARISVTFEHVRNPEGLLLAIAGAPYGNVLGDRHATVDGERVAVRGNLVEDGRTSFELSDCAKRECGRIDWSFTMSNIAAFTEADLNDFGLAPSKRRPAMFPNCPPGYDQVSTRVLVPSGELVLALQLDEGAGNVVEASAMVEQEHGTDGVTRWTVDNLASKRCAISRRGVRSVVLTCKYPEVGQRYSLIYRADATGWRLPSQASSLSRLLLDIALRSPPRPDQYDVVGGMTRGVQNAIWLCLSDGEMPFSSPSTFLGRGTDWIGLLWDHERKRLYPAFGEFVRHDWSVSFAAGETARGHAFRFAHVSGWHPQVSRSRILAPPPNQSRRERDRKFEDSWNLSVPLRVGPLGPAIGVVSLHGSVPIEPERRFERELELLAERCGDEDRTQEEADLLSGFERAVNLGFWNSLTELGTFLGKPEIKFARKVAAEFGALGVRDSAASAQASRHT
jgi:3',5'-cyclic AMP phosphodiesterase CpdA